MRFCERSRTFRRPRSEILAVAVNRLLERLSEKRRELSNRSEPPRLFPARLTAVSEGEDQKPPGISPESELLERSSFSSVVMFRRNIHESVPERFCDGRRR